MKTTKRQKNEIAFLCKHFGGVDTPDNVEDYILATTRGISSTEDKLSPNSLRTAKTRLDRNVKMWREGLDEDVLFPWELEEDFGYHPFGKKVIKSTIVSTRNWQHYYSNQIVALSAFAIRNKDSLTGMTIKHD